MFNWLKNLLKPQEVLVNGFDIAKLNRTINKQIRYKRDEVNDLVTGRNIKVGDCEDIAGCKYLHLKDKGIDSGPVLVQNWNGEWHMVLVVQNYVLDNKTDRVYSFWKMQKEMGYRMYNAKVPDEVFTQRKYQLLFDKLT